MGSAWLMFSTMILIGIVFAIKIMDVTPQKNNGRKLIILAIVLFFITANVLIRIRILGPRSFETKPNNYGGITYQKTVIDPKGFVEIMETKGFRIVENPEAYGSIELKAVYIATSPSGEYELAYIVAETNDDALRVFGIYSMQIENRKWKDSHVVSESPIGNYITKSQQINESYWRVDCVDNVTIVVDGANSEYIKEINKIYSQLIQ